jgi:hypothetical protein
VSETHIMGPSISVCRVFPGGRPPTWSGVIVAQQWVPTVTILLLFLYLLLLLFLGLAFAGLYTLPIDDALVQNRSSRPQENRDCPRGALPPTGLCHFRGISPRRGTAPTPSPNQDYLIPGDLLPRPFPRMHASLGPDPQRLLLQRLCPTGHLSPALASTPGHSCASTSSIQLQ